MKHIALILMTFLMAPFCVSAQVTESAPVAVHSSADSEEATLQAFAKKWTEKDQFTVSWHYAQFGYSFTAYPKKGEFIFNSTEYCERGVHKAFFFTREGKFWVKVLRENRGCVPMIMFFDPVTGEGKAGEGEIEAYSILPGRRLRLAE